VLTFNNIFDGAQPILPTARDSRGIESCHIKLNPEINAHPVDEAAGRLGYWEPFTAIRYACENLDWVDETGEIFAVMSSIIRTTKVAKRHTGPGSTTA
jgi:hypothetical protein